MADNYQDLIAWQKARTLALNVCRCTRRFPKDEIYGLSSQIRNAAVLVPTNIAEGYGRYSQREFVQFLYHALGSLRELETQLAIARDLEYINLPEFEKLKSETEELRQILNGLINRFQLLSQRAS